MANNTKPGPGWTARTILIAFLLAIAHPLAHAATLRVGPGEQLTRIAEAAKLTKDGDTVEILPGEYRGDVAVWQQKSLTIRGLGQRPVLIADGKSAEGKAIWVIRNGNIRIENIEFRGARVSDGNGAGIRFEKGKLLVRDCSFLDNQNGILTANFGDAELVIENSLFAQAPHQTDSLPHLLYVGRIGRLAISGSRFHGGYRGHLIKSRAKVSDIRYNLIHDGPGGEASYEINLPNGGIATLIGNIVGQSDKTQNPVVISYGEEGNTWPENRLTLAHNTLYSERLKGTWFLRAPFDKFPAPPTVLAVNNLTAGLGLFTLAARGEFHGNLPALPNMLSDPDTLDFSLTTSLPLRWLGFVTEKLPDELIPTAEFTLPIGTRPLTPPTSWVPGAIQIQ